MVMTSTSETPGRRPVGVPRSAEDDLTDHYLTLVEELTSPMRDWVEVGVGAVAAAAALLRHLRATSPEHADTSTLPGAVLATVLPRLEAALPAAAVTTIL